jgi:Sec-independent protein translocase protein TatA
MRTLMTSALLLPVFLAVGAGAEKPDYLSDDEVDQLREAQAPSERIEKYLSFAQDRLTRFDDYRNRPPNPDYDIPGYLDTQLDQYIRITDALKDWIEDHFDRHDDMRAGLKKILEMGRRQLEQLRHIEQSSDPYAPGYRKTLGDAIDDFTDALDGATKALSEQSKLFGELKREEKADAQTVKDRAKEEKKRTKDEEKLRKKEHEKGPPTDKDED